MATRGFVTISDHRYFDGVVALINSLRRHHDLPISVLDEGMHDDQRRALDRAEVDVRRVARSIPVNSPRFGCCYALFDVDAAPYDTIVCIDPDAIVLAPLHEVFDAADAHGIVATAANGAGRFIEPGYRQKFAKSLPRGKFVRPRFLLQFPRYLKYVLGVVGRPLSSGVVGVRRELLPAIRSATTKYSGYFHTLRWPDQDLLSYCLLDLGIDWHALPYEYNAARIHEAPEAGIENGFCDQLNEILEFDIGEFDLQVRNRKAGCLAGDGLRIKVLHYAGPAKPWTDRPLRAGFRELWLRHHDGGRLRVSRRTPLAGRVTAARAPA